MGLLLLLTVIGGFFGGGAGALVGAAIALAFLMYQET